MSEDRLAIIERKVDTIETKVEIIDGKVGELRASIDDLGHQMLVLHEHTVDKIKALAPDFGPVRSEFKAADAKLKEEIDRRLTPLEAEARSRAKKES
jgi:hypothetical protein